MAWKRFFFDGLWPARNKWEGAGTMEDMAADVNTASKGDADFRISVCVRFRPAVEPPPDTKLALPLNQFVKLKRNEMRKKKREAEAAGAGVGDAFQSSIVVGTPVPERFLDPCMGHIMRDPVRLPSSGAVVDRKVAVAHMRRFGTDVMDSTPLTNESLLESCPDLLADLEAWRIQHESECRDLDKVQRSSVVDGLVKGEHGLAPEVLEALCEADRLEALARAAEEASYRSEMASGGQGTEGIVEAEMEGVGAAGAADDANGTTDEDEEDAGAITASAAELTEGLESAEEVVKEHRQDEEERERAEEAMSRGRDRAVTERSTRVLGIQSSRVVMYCAGQGVRPFPFSRVFDGKSDQARVYDQCARPAVAACFNGFNACIMAYGQTGSGKTHTQFGPPAALEGATVVNAESGVVIRALNEAVCAAVELEASGVTTRLAAQYVEIYNDDVTDLLTGSPCGVRRNGTVHGAVECPVEDLESGLRLLRAGQVRRTVAATAMNQRSSRAHTIFLLHVRQSRGDAFVSATLNLVDLAGSERLKKSKAEGSRKIEAVGINKSLMVLGKVISALVEGHSHVPYFETKLTTLLRGALGGASRTTALVCCRQDDAQADETLQALRFGERCALVTNAVQHVAASSASEAIQAIDSTLEASEAQLASLKARGKEKLAAYKGLQDRIEQLRQRRRAIADVARAER